MLQTQCPKKNLKKKLARLQQALQEGYPLAESLIKIEAIPPLFSHWIACGEQAGKLGHCLNLLATHYEKSKALQQKLKTLLIYPSCVLGFSLIIALLLCFFVLPSFETLFHSFNTPLPQATQRLLKFSQSLQTQGLLWLCALGLTLLLLGFVLGQFKLHWPFLGPVFKKIMVLRYTQTLHLGLSAGVPLTQVLKTTALACGHPRYQRATEQVQQAIQQGSSLFEAMQATAVFPEPLLQMVHWGEQAGTLDHLLEQASELYLLEVDQKLERLSQIFEPLLLIFVGSLVGTLLITLYLPLFSMGHLF